MADAKPQSLSNHSRLDPLYHFLIAPIFGVALIGGLYHLIKWPGFHSGVFFVLSVGLFALTYRARTYPLKVQDRVIRLEERLRLMTLCPEGLRSRIAELTEDQLIALRFASDGEVCALAERALTEKLSRADIKKAIKNWRPDNWRV